MEWNCWVEQRIHRKKVLPFDESNSCHAPAPGRQIYRIFPPQEYRGVSYGGEVVPGADFRRRSFCPQNAGRSGEKHGASKCIIKFENARIAPVYLAITQRLYGVAGQK